MTGKDDALFAQRCAEIAVFVRTHGHDRIPVRVDGKLNPLGHWCNQRRYSWRRGRLGPERVALLEAAGLHLAVAEPRPRTVRPRASRKSAASGPNDEMKEGRAKRRRVRRQKPVIRLSIQGDRERLAQASRLVAESMRPPLIQSLLALPESVIRRLWQAHHRRQAPGGQLPMDAANLLLRPRLAAHGAVYASAYLRYAGNMGFRSMNPAALIAGLDLYRQIVSDPCITGTMAWYIARDLRNRDLLAYRTCTKCGAPYLTAPHGTHLRGCVFCEMRSQNRKKAGTVPAHRPSSAEPTSHPGVVRGRIDP